MFTLTTRFCNTPALTINTVAFTCYGKRQHDVIVGEDGTVRVYDSTAKYFTRCHSISPRVQGVIRSRWAKAWKDRVAHAAGRGFGISREGMCDAGKRLLSTMMFGLLTTEEMVAGINLFFSTIGAEPTAEAKALLAERN